LDWSLCRQELGSDKHTVTGARGLGGNWAYRDAEAPAVRDFVGDEPAAREWNALVAELATWPFMAEEDPAESLTLYVGLGEAEKSLVAAIVAGQALVRSANVPGWRVRAHDRLPELAGGTNAAMRRQWTPRAALRGPLPKLQRLDRAQPHVDPEAFRSWHRQDDKTISGACAGALEQVPEWVHPLLSFNVEDPPRPTKGDHPQDGGEAPADEPAQQNPGVNEAVEL